MRSTLLGHDFNFAGGDKLAKIGATWFVSYCYYDLIDKSHLNWMSISTVSSRKSTYANTGVYHHLWLEEILKMDIDRLNSNTINLNGFEVKKMAEEILSRPEFANNTNSEELSSAQSFKILPEKELFRAIKENDTEKVKELIENKDENGLTPLLQAIKNKSIDTVKLLVNAGADVNARDKNGWTSLRWAAKNNAADVAKLLLDAKANVDLRKGKDGWTSLMTATQHNSVDVAKLLIDAGADINVKDHDGWTPLICAAVRNSVDVAKILLEAGANIEEKSLKTEWINERTAVIWAVSNDSRDVAKLLFYAGARFDISSEDGRKLLKIAELASRFEIASLIRSAKSY